MHEQEIRTYAGLMEELQLTGLEVEADGVRVRLERLHAPAAPVVVSQTPVSTAAPAAAKAEADGDVVEVTSPMVGVFYSAPAENGNPRRRKFPGIRGRKHPGSRPPAESEKEPDFWP